MSTTLSADPENSPPAAPRSSARQAPLASYRDLIVWKRAIELAVESYRLADRLPVSERFALAAQVRRAAASIPANIAEGYGRLHRGDYIHHLSIARGSLKELETHVIIAHRLGYATPADSATLDRACWRVSRLLGRLVQSLYPKSGV